MGSRSRRESGRVRARNLNPHSYPESARPKKSAFPAKHSLGDEGYPSGKITQCASCQLAPTPRSTTSGTANAAAVVIHSRIPTLASATASAATSNTSSSCTCMIILAATPLSCSQPSVRIIARLMMSAAVRAADRNILQIGIAGGEPARRRHRLVITGVDPAGARIDLFRQAVGVGRLEFAQAPVIQNELR